MGQIIQLIDSYTKENVNYEEVATWHDGTAMDDGKVDNVIYRKKGTKYYKRIFKGEIQIAWFGAIGDDFADDTIAFKKAIAYTGASKLVLDYNKVYKLTDRIDLPESYDIELNSSVMKFYIPSGNNKKCLVLNKYNSIVNGSIELKHSVPGTTTISGEYLSPISTGIYIYDEHQTDGIVLKKLKIKTNVNAIAISFLGTKNSVVEDVFIDGGGYCYAGVQFHWSNTVAMVKDETGNYIENPDSTKLKHTPNNNIIKNVTFSNFGAESFGVYLSGCYNIDITNLFSHDGTLGTFLSNSAGDYSLKGLRIEDKKLFLTGISVKGVYGVVNRNILGSSSLASTAFNNAVDMPSLGTIYLDQIIAKTTSFEAAGMYFYRMKDVKYGYINIKGGLYSLQISNGTSNIEGDTLYVSDANQIGLLLSSIDSPYFDKLKFNLNYVNISNKADTSNTESMNISLSGVIEKGYIETAVLGSTSDSEALNNLYFNSGSKNVEINRIISKGAKGSRIVNNSNIIYKDIVAANVKINRIDNLGSVPLLYKDSRTSPHDFYFDVVQNKNIPIYYRPETSSLESTGIKGTIVLFYNGGGAYLEDEVNNIWQYFGITAKACPDIATTPGETYSQSEMKALFDEFRDMKAKLINAGQLKGNK